MAKRRREATSAEIIATFDDDTRAFAAWMRDDPVAFCRHVVGKQPHKAQQDFLRSRIYENMHVMLPWGRQFGKSWITAVYIAWCLFAFSDFSVFIFSPSEGQSKQIFDYVADIYRKSDFLKRFLPVKELGNFIHVGGADWNSKLELVRIGHEGRLGKGRSSKGRGLIVFDEYALFLATEAIKANLTPIIASGGGEIVLSSPGDPDSPMHELYRIWSAFEKEGNEKYRVIPCRWQDTEHLTPDWVEGQRREAEAKGALWYFEREVLGRWVAPANTWFPHEDIKRCELTTRPDWRSGDTFVWAMDMGGRGRSACVIAVARFNQALGRLEVVDLRQFHFENHKYYRNDTGSEVLQGSDADCYEQIVEICCDMRRQYPPAWVGIDPNTERSLTGRLENVYQFPVSEIRIGGYESKEAFLTSLRNGVKECRIVWADSRISKQLQIFCPKRDETTGRWKFPDKNTDIIVCMGNLYQYLGQMELTPFECMAGTRPEGKRFSVW